MESTEEWRPVSGFEGYYEVSDLGRVRSVDRVVQNGPRPMRLRGKVLKPTPTHRGDYLTVSLCRGARQRPILIHLLVAEAFVGPRLPGMEVRHLDGDGLNNTPENLRWGTHVENEGDKLRHGTHHQIAKTHCPQRHPYDEANTYAYFNPKTGGWARICRACRAARAKAKAKTKEPR